MKKCGFFGVKIPKKWGGAGFDTRAYVIMNEELASVSPISAIYANTPNSLGGGPLLSAGTDEQLEKYLKPLAQGDKIISFALTEPGAGSDAGGVQTTAVKMVIIISSMEENASSHMPLKQTTLLFLQKQIRLKGLKGYLLSL